MAQSVAESLRVHSISTRAIHRQPPVRCLMLSGRHCDAEIRLGSKRNKPSLSIHTDIYSLTQTGETRLNQSSWNIQRQRLENRKKQETVPLQRGASAVAQWGKIVASTASATHTRRYVLLNLHSSPGCSPRNDAPRRLVLRARDSTGQGQTPPLRTIPKPPPSSCVSVDDALTASY